MKTSRNLWPLGIVIAFVLFIAGLATAVTIAATHRDHLVSENYYEQELRFQSQIDSAALARKAGATIAFDAAARKVTLTLPPAQLAQKFSGKIECYRPVAPELDHELPLTPDSGGVQSLDVSKLAPGSWLVRVKWSAGGETYFLEQKIKI
jgi:hypothetical protein